MDTAAKPCTGTTQTGERCRNQTSHPTGWCGRCAGPPAALAAYAPSTAPVAAGPGPDPLGPPPVVMVTYEVEPQVLTAAEGQQTFHIDFDALDSMRRNTELGDAAAYIEASLRELDGVAAGYPHLAGKLAGAYEGLVDFTYDQISRQDVDNGYVEAGDHDLAAGAVLGSFAGLCDTAARWSSNLRAVYRVIDESRSDQCHQPDPAAVETLRQRILTPAGDCADCADQPVPGVLWPAGGPQGAQAAACGCRRYPNDSDAAHAAGIALGGRVTRSSDWSGFDVTDPDPDLAGPAVVAHLGLLAS